MKTRFGKIVAAFAVFLLSLSAYACDKAIADSRSIRELAVAAEKGNADAQAMLGLAYLQGSRGAPKDLVIAKNWLSQSAKSKSILGQFLLGYHYLQNAKDDRDYAEAAALLSAASERGCVSAKFYLGALRLEGKGVGKNVQRGIEEIRSAAESGSIYAQLWLGSSYAAGEYVGKDPAAGFEWIKRAAAGGDSLAEMALANLYASGIGIEQDVTEAERILKGVFSRGDEHAATAAFMLGWMEMENVGGVGDPAEALRWMVKAESGNVSGSNARVQSLVERLPRRETNSACPINPLSPDQENAADTTRALVKGDIVAILSSTADYYEVYSPTAKAIGYIGRACLNTGKE